MIVTEEELCSSAHVSISFCPLSSPTPSASAAPGPPQSCRRCAASPGRKPCDVTGCWGPASQRNQRRRGCPRSPHWRGGYDGPRRPLRRGGAAAAPRGTSRGLQRAMSGGHQEGPDCERTCRYVSEYPSSFLLPLCAWWDYHLLLGDNCAVWRSTNHLLRSL